MDHRIKFFILLLSLCFIFATNIFAEEVDKTGKKAPDFILKDMNGQNYSLHQNFEKGPILINFWATWCIPCKEELKELKKIDKKYNNDGLEILAISIDDPKTASRVKNFINSRNYPFTVLMDTNSEVLRLYQAKNPPYTALLDSHGNIVFTKSGYRKGDEKILEDEIIDLLKQNNEANSDDAE